MVCGARAWATTTVGRRSRTIRLEDSTPALRIRAARSSIVAWIPLLRGNVMKISHAAILALVLPLSLPAQQAPTAAQAANPITTVFRTRTMALQRNLAQAFDSIPESKFGY